MRFMFKVFDSVILIYIQVTQNITDIEKLSDGQTLGMSDTVMGALIGAIITILCTVVYDRQKEKDRRLNNLKYFAVLIRSLINYSNTVSSNIVSYSQNLAENLFAFPEFNKIPNDIFDKVARKSSEEPLFYAFTDNYKDYPEMLGKFEKIGSDIMFQKEMYDHFLLELEKYRVGYSELSREYQKLFNGLVVFLRERMLPLELRENNQFHEHVYEMFMQYIETEETQTSISNTWENFGSQLRSAIIVNTYVSLPNGMELLEMLNTIHFTYKSIEIKMNELLTFTNRVSQALNESNNRLNENSRSFVSVHHPPEVRSF